MTAPAATARSVPNLTNLQIELHHRHRLAGPERGLQEWHIRILDGEREVGSLRAARCLYYDAANLAERMADHGGLCALAAGALLTPDGGFTPELEEAVEQPGNFLVLDQLNIATPFEDQTVVTAVVAEVIGRLTDNYYAVVLPRATPNADAGTRLLAQAATDLAAEPVNDELQLIDTCLAAPEDAAARRCPSHAMSGHRDSQVTSLEGHLATPSPQVLAFASVAVCLLVPVSAERALEPRSSSSPSCEDLLPQAGGLTGTGCDDPRHDRMPHPGLGLPFRAETCGVHQ